MDIEVTESEEKVRVCVSEKRGSQFFYFSRVGPNTLQELPTYGAVGFVASLDDEAEARKNARIALAKREAIIAVM